MTVSVLPLIISTIPEIKNDQLESPEISVSDNKKKKKKRRAWWWYRKNKAKCCKNSSVKNNGNHDLGKQRENLPTKQPPKRQLKQKQLREVEQVVQWDTLCLLHETLIENCPKLRCKLIPKNIFENVRNKSVVRLANDQMKKFTLDKTNYGKPLETLLFAEEIFESIEMRKYDLFNKQIKKIPDPEHKQPYWLEVRLPGLSKGQPSLIPTDKVVLEEYRRYEICDIVDIEGDRVRFKRAKSDRKLSEPIEAHKFNISFVASGISFARYHKAIRLISDNRYLRDSLFESAPGVNGIILPSHNLAIERISIAKTATRELDQRLLFCNDRQRQAIIGILEARCRPKPYILFGPPGTGKTFTLVESIVQVYKRNKNFNILVCANSNNCADQLAELINQTKLVDSMKRYNSLNHYRKKPRIFTYDTESKMELKKFRIVVTTNNLSANLLGVMQFDYVFIDEAGHAHEPESLIPIINLGKNGCLVLAGDPKQLGPVIKCREVEKLGLGQSMLERLFKLQIYKRDEYDGQYDQNFITKLIISYRCDPRILKICNKLFYQDELSCLGQCPETLLKDLELTHPLVFHRLRGRESRIATSTSRCNEMEADLCVDYVMKLYNKGISADKIGIISPYLLQKEIIREKLSQRLKTNKLIAQLESLSLTDKKASSIEKQQLAPSGVGDAKLDLNANVLSIIRQSLIRSRSDNNENDNTVVDSSRRKKSGSKGAKKEDNVAKRLTKKKKRDWMCQVDTVDAFQGKEKEIIIISTVRTPNNFGSIDQCGFLADAKRFNVAISRAKWLVIVIGHPAVINCHANWMEFKKHSTAVTNIV